MTSRLVLVLLFLCGCGDKRGRAEAQDIEAKSAVITLSVVATNDVHGRVEQLPLLGGYLRNLRRARERDHGAVLLLDAGDMLQGTLESNLGEGAAMIRGFNALGYAAASVGNHEFDFGPVGPHAVVSATEDDPLGALKARAQEARFALLAANLRKKDGGPLSIPGIVPSLMLERAGIRIGIVGGMTKDALTQTQAANVSELSLSPLPATIASEARALRARGAQVVIALVHAGGECRDFHLQDVLLGCDDKAEVFELARSLSVKDVDLIVGGHTHAGVAHRVHGIPIIESYSNARAFGRVDLEIDTHSGKVVTQRIHPPHELCTEALDKTICTNERYEGELVQRDAKVQQALAADFERARSERMRPLGVELASDLVRSPKAESALGNLVVDLVRGAYQGADAAVNNGGSIRTNLHRGPLRYGQLFEMFPFDNALAELRVTAGELAAMIAANLQNDRGFLSLSGLRAQARCEGDVLRVSILRDDGKRVPDQTPLRVITSDFLASGGDGLLHEVGLQPGAVQIHRERMMRDAFVEELAARKGRIDGSDKTLFDPDHPRISYPGARPVRCH